MHELVAASTPELDRNSCERRIKAYHLSERKSDRCWLLNINQSCRPAAVWPTSPFSPAVAKAPVSSLLFLSNTCLLIVYLQLAWTFVQEDVAKGKLGMGSSEHGFVDRMTTSTFTYLDRKRYSRYERKISKEKRHANTIQFFVLRFLSLFYWKLEMTCCRCTLCLVESI